MSKILSGFTVKGYETLEQYAQCVDYTLRLWQSTRNNAQNQWHKIKLRTNMIYGIQ